VSLYDWLLFLHVLTAFALVAALVVFWVIGIVARNNDVPSVSLQYFRVARPAQVMVAIGTLGTLIFGIALAIERDEYQVWDGWILGAIALWLIATGLGDGVRRRVERSGPGGAIVYQRPIMLMHWLRTLAVVGLLVLMIWKPGA
jgi:hypothetical protein